MNTLLKWLQNNSAYTLIFGIILLFLIVFAAFKAGQAVTRLSMSSVIKKAREDALNRSKAVLGGLAAEQVAPFLPEFPCSPADCRFVGKPVDFIAFPGSSAGEEIKEVLLIEVKTGESQLSKREKEIRDCIEKGRVRYCLYRI
jgi:predicted Holliday junction resolvase-like endonuclease